MFSALGKIFVGEYICLREHLSLLFVIEAIPVETHLLVYYDIPGNYSSNVPKQITFRQ